MRGAAIAVLAGVSFATGAYIVAVHEPVPTTRIVTVHLPAKVVTQTVHNTKTVTITKPLPASCTLLVNDMAAILASASKVDTGASKFIQEIEDGQVDVLLDPAKSNKVKAVLNKIQSNMDDNLLPALDLNNDLDVSIKACKDDMGSSE